MWVMDQLKRGRAVNREDDERRDGLACYGRCVDCRWSRGRGLSDAGRNVKLAGSAAVEPS